MIANAMGTAEISLRPDRAHDRIERRLGLVEA